MTETLPAPASRTEQFLAKAAGMSGVELPTPASREELYLNAIAEGGGGGGTSYTAGDGIDITDNTISVDTDTIQPKLTAGTGIDITDNTISATGGGATGEAKKLTSADYNWNNAAGNATTEPFDTVALWLLPSGLYMGADGIYVRPNLNNRDNSNQRSYIVSADTVVALITQFSDSVSLGSGPIRVYRTLVGTGVAQDNARSGVMLLNTSMLQQSTGTSTTDVMSQNAVTEMVFSDDTKTRIKIGNNVTLNSVGNSQYVAIGAGSSVSSSGTAIGASANAGHQGVAIASGVESSQSAVAGENAVSIGTRTTANGRQSVALGFGATASSQGQFDIGCGIYTTAGYNSSGYRLLSGLYDGQNAHDAATVGQINATIDAINTALSTNIPHIGAAS